MTSRTIRKTVIAILAVVIAGIVYCVFFTEEKSTEVQYLTEEESNNPVISPEELREEKMIWVHICGAVKVSGVYSLPEGARVCDVIRMAGGLSEGAAADYVNQARFLLDGERVYIPEMTELTGLSASQYAAGQAVTLTGSSAGDGYPVNINTAGVSELMTLPGIGESRAESIIAYREQNGGFTSIEDIMQISGIKGAAYEKIKDRICTGYE